MESPTSHDRKRKRNGEEKISDEKEEKERDFDLEELMDAARLGKMEALKRILDGIPLYC